LRYLNIGECTWLAAIFHRVRLKWSHKGQMREG
jgi:hypothetical protein